MTTAFTFSRQNDAGSRAPTTQYLENLVFVLDLESVYLSLHFKHIRKKLIAIGIQLKI